MPLPEDPVTWKDGIHPMLIPSGFEHLIVSLTEAMFDLTLVPTSSVELLDEVRRSTVFNSPCQC